MAVHNLRLTCYGFWVDVRVAGFNGRWVASADTPDGPSLGLGFTPRTALMLALEPFDRLVHELLASAPAELLEHGGLAH